MKQGEREWLVTDGVDPDGQRSAVALQVDHIVSIQCRDGHPFVTCVDGNHYNFADLSYDATLRQIGIIR